MNWIITNWDTVINIITGVVTVASLVTKLTPNTADNKVTLGIQQAIETIALNSKPVTLEKK